jgi:hypothetical protein
MLGTEKFMQYFEETAGPHPILFLRDGGSLDVCKANIQKLQMRKIYCVTGRNGKEFLIIPIGYSNIKLFALLLSGNSKPELLCFHRRFLKMTFGWLQCAITPVAVEDLSLYVNHKYKTTFLTNILQGTLKIELPITNKVIKSYTQAGIYNVSYAY